MGELQTEPFQFTFNGFLKVAFQGSRVTSDAGLILVRELDERLGLERIIAAHLRDWCRVASTTCCSRAAVICRFRPLPGASRRNASGPAAANRRRHNRTVSWLVSSCRATCGLGIPRAASKTIRLRKTNRCGVVPARNQRSNVARCSSVSGNTATRFMGGKAPNLPPNVQVVSRSLH